MVAGAPFANVNLDSGAAYVFQKPKGGWRSETETAKLTASGEAEGDEVGFAVAIDHDTVVVGAPGTGVPNPATFAEGAAYVFLRPPGGGATRPRPPR